MPFLNSSGGQSVHPSEFLSIQLSVFLIKRKQQQQNSSSRIHANIYYQVRGHPLDCGWPESLKKVTLAAISFPQRGAGHASHLLPLGWDFVLAELALHPCPLSQPTQIPMWMATRDTSNSVIVFTQKTSKRLETCRCPHVGAISTEHPR